MQIGQKMNFLFFNQKNRVMGLRNRLFSSNSCDHPAIDQDICPVGGTFLDSVSY